MKTLPGWAVYLISGLGAVVLVLLGVVGTLASKDRLNVDLTLQRIEKLVIDQRTYYDTMLKAQTEQITELSKHNEKQNHIMDKMCWLMTLSHPERMRLFDKYPVMNPKNKLEDRQ